MWQVCSRVLEQGSRLPAVRLASRCAAGPLLELDTFTDDDLYRNLDGLTREQVRIGDCLATLQTREDLRNAWLELHRRASPESSARRLEEGVDRLSLKDWVRLRVRGRRIEVVIDEVARAEAFRLDGRYALKTDVPTGRADAQTIHERYRNLKWVEHAFRTCKTGHLAFRSVWVRRERRTRAHALVVMLAYRIARHLQQAWQDLDVTVEEGPRDLSALCITQLEVRKELKGEWIPEPTELGSRLLAAAGVDLPRRLHWKPEPQPNQPKPKPRRNVPTKSTERKHLE